MLRGQTLDGKRGERDHDSLGPYRAAPMAEQVQLPEDIWVHRCSGCKGVWISAKELAEALRSLAIVDAPDPPAKLSYGRADGIADCPRCQVDLTVRRANAARVNYDQCGSCGGVWFDAGELRHFADPFVAMSALLRDFRQLRTRQPELYETKPRQPNVMALVFDITTPRGQCKKVHHQREIIKIGRRESSHLRFDDYTVSPLHAVIEVRGDIVEVLDLNSGTGTLVNGERVSKQRLNDGDQIRVGDAVITVSFAK